MSLICKLPYPKIEEIVINKFTISGKLLNTVPLKMLSNDKSINNNLSILYDELKELEGTNVNGILEHSELLKEKIYNLKNLFLEIENKQIEFLKRNDCNIPLCDLFIDYNDTNCNCDIYAQFDNVHLRYADDELNTSNCGCPVDYEDCKDC